jgi:phage tail sheath protein FI
MMSGSYSYPGIYLQELPFNTHTVQAAPTSIAAFVGYVNPWATAAAETAFGSVMQLFSFTDYETYFGGMFSSGLVDPSLPRAVFQFFANGGSIAYVVGLKPLAATAGGPVDFLSPNSAAAFTASLTTSGANGVQFTAKQFVDQVPMGLIVSNPRKTVAASAGFDTFDVAITYGNTIETYRGVMIGLAAQATPAAAPDMKIGKNSSLVTVSALSGSFGNTLAPAAATTYPFTCPALSTLTTTFNAADFIDVLQADTALDKIEIFNLLLVPGIADNGVQSAALAFAEHKLAFAILDPPANATVSGLEGGLKIADFANTMPRSQNGGIYFPWLQSTDTITSDSIQVAPSGYVAGVFARTDVARGVWKAPAGMATGLLNTVGPVPSGLVTDGQHGDLNINQAVNCLRQFASIGTVVFGARTLVGNNDAYAQSKYVPVRRMTLFLEQTLKANLRWVVFEPNDDPLWSAIRLSIEAFLLGLWNQGALQGATPAAAFQVKCDNSTTTSADQQNGIVNIVVAFAPLKPAEFVVIKIAQLAGQAAS